MSYTVIASAKAASSNSRTVSTAATPINVTGADLIVIVEGIYSNPLPGPTDNFGNVFVPMTVESGTLGAYVQFWICENPITGSGYAASINAAAVVFPSIIVLALSGSASSPFDVQNGAQSGTPGLVTPSEANELVLTALVTSTGDPGIVDSSFSVVQSINFSANNLGLALGLQVQTTATPRNPTWAGTGIQASIIAAFKALSTPPSSPLVTLALNTVAGTDGGSSTLTLTLSSSGGALPVGVQFTLNFTADVSLLSVVLGSAATAASKLLAQSGNIVLIYGLNTNVISNGVLATIAFHVAPSPVANPIPISLTGAVVTDATGTFIPIATLPGAITLPAPPPPSEWFTVDPATGLITGTPTVPGVYPFTAQVRDSTGTTITVSCAITVPAIIPAGSPCANVVPLPTDTFFELQRIYAAMKPAPRLPTRGS
jgi:hypothetical protein